MDKFEVVNAADYNLKSSMERFIVSRISISIRGARTFKIQYGEIYRL